MTGFVTADIPASINTVEKLHAWTSTILNHLYPGVTAIEENGQAELVATAAPFQITAISPPQWRFIDRCSMPLNSNWQRGAGKLWANVEDLGSASIPTEFKS